VENKDKGVSGIECGDFLVFNFILLLIIPTNCSIALRICIAFGCIVIVQLADLCNDFKDLSARLLGTIAATAYAIIVDEIKIELRGVCLGDYTISIHTPFLFIFYMQVGFKPFKFSFSELDRQTF
jgi:hypothetical protein